MYKIEQKNYKWIITKNGNPVTIQEFPKQSILANLMEDCGSWKCWNDTQEYKALKFFYEKHKDIWIAYDIVEGEFYHTENGKFIEEYENDFDIG